MSQAFVGTRSVESGQALKDLLEQCPAPNRQYFLRWVHQAKWAEVLPPEFPSPEGELMTPEFELRWKQAGQGYDLLLLAASDSPQLTEAFEPLARFRWLASAPLGAHLLGQGAEQDLRFPQAIRYPASLKLQQRYFQDQQTGTVHFVARTLAG
jgi:hypothetical protein